jgi:uncharacterized membrane protein
MGTGRIEAFSDGVIAVIITIMVLELKLPRDAAWGTLSDVVPHLLVYALSFVVVAAFWVNHHHLLHRARFATPAVLWSNIALLFSMSLIPFVTAYLTEDAGAPPALVSYALVLALSSAAFCGLIAAVARQYAEDPARAAQFARMSVKAYVAIALYAASALLAFVSSYIAYAVFIAIPALYFLPDSKLVEPGL